MEPDARRPPGPDEREISPEELGPPRGTLAIVFVFGLLMAVGWLAFYVFGFLARGATGS